MENIKNSIYDAYYSQNGQYGKKVRERVHWVTQNVTGSEVLDVGCSQGITSILLAREGKKILGIDSSTAAIEQAIQNLNKEEEDTRNLIQFEKSNFFLKNFNQEFDTVILGEILEHITDIDTFFNKTNSLIREGGRIIITTPFGINESNEFKRTIYLNELLNLQTPTLIIDEIKFMGKWIGVVYKKLSSPSNEGKVIINESLLKRIEETFYLIEEEYLTQIQQPTANSIDKNQYFNEIEEKVKLKKELIETYNKVESLINQNKKLLQENEALLRKYKNLRNSKFGKLASRYWKLRNKRRSK